MYYLIFVAKKPHVVHYMIYTITLNPSLDYYLTVENFALGKINKASQNKICVGGKGINVALKLKELGNEPCAIAFIGGFVGEKIKEEIKASGLCHKLYTASGTNRINVKIKADEETDINGNGLLLEQEKLAPMICELKAQLKKGDYLVLSGSAPTPLTDNAYATIIESLGNIDGVNLVVDACKNLLCNTLKFKPFLIKPNLDELCEIFALDSITTEQLPLYARKLQERGARNVLVSLGGKGAFLLSESGEEYTQAVTAKKAINTVGAGDCMVAAFIHEYQKSGNKYSSLKFAAACSDAYATCGETLDRAYINELLNN